MTTTATAIVSRRRRIGGFWEFDTDRVATGGMKNTSNKFFGLSAMNRFGTLRPCALSWRAQRIFQPSRAASETRMGFVRLQNGGESHHRTRWWLLEGYTSGVMAPGYPTGTVDRRVGSIYVTKYTFSADIDVFCTGMIAVRWG